MERVIDINVSLGFWPFQRFSVYEPADLSRKLKQAGITAAWVSSIESVLYPDPDVYDMQLWEKLCAFDELHMVKTVNPLLGNWRESLRLWVEERGIRAVKCFPNYHQYSLRDGFVGDMASMLRNYSIPLMIQMRVDDERAHYPLMKVPGVPCEEVVDLAGRMPELPIVALCACYTEVKSLTAASNIHVDTSYVETLDTLAVVLRDMPASRVLFGSHTPFLTLESEMMKLSMGNIDVGQREMIAGQNAKRLF